MIRLTVCAPDELLISTHYENSISFGRSPSTTILLRGNTVSRKHAVIEKTLEGYRLRDLSSRTGTSLNGKRIRSAILDTGDTIVIGPVTIYVQEVTAVTTQFEVNSI
jgi:pSer/pThr/pTyr-binding forkhead associated (FHA) protein